jgi:hypothetical protein
MNKIRVLLDVFTKLSIKYTCPAVNQPQKFMLIVVRLQHDLRYVLGNAQLTAMLDSALALQHSAENLRFWLAVESFRQQSDTDKVCCFRDFDSVFFKKMVMILATWRGVCNY